MQTLISFHLHFYTDMSPSPIFHWTLPTEFFQPKKHHKYSWLKVNRVTLRYTPVTNKKSRPLFFKHLQSKIPSNAVFDKESPLYKLLHAKVQQSHISFFWNPRSFPFHRQRRSRHSSTRECTLASTCPWSSLS